MTQAAVAPVTTPFDQMGEVGARRLVDAFYDAMERDPAARELRAIHQPDLGPMRERLADWLTGWLGGPKVYAIRHHGRPCIVSAHRSLSIGAEDARQWMNCMRQAFEAVDLTPALRNLLDPAFERMCEGLRTH